MRTTACFAALATVLLLSSCSSVPAAFPAGTEFGARLEAALSGIHEQGGLFKATVEYPENFREATIEGTLAFNKESGGFTLILTGLKRDTTQLCVTGDLLVAANSKGVRNQDDNGRSIVFQSVRPTTTTLINQQVCSGPPDQISCFPQVMPMIEVGPLSIIMSSAGGPLKLKRGSLMVFRLYDGRCAPAQKPN